MGPNKPKSRVAVRLPGPEVRGSGNRDEDMGHRLVKIICSFAIVYVNILDIVIGKCLLVLSEY